MILPHISTPRPTVPREEVVRLYERAIALAPGSNYSVEQWMLVLHQAAAKLREDPEAFAAMLRDAQEVFTEFLEVMRPLIEAAAQQAAALSLAIAQVVELTGALADDIEFSQENTAWVDCLTGVSLEPIEADDDDVV